MTIWIFSAFGGSERKKTESGRGGEERGEGRRREGDGRGKNCGVVSPRFRAALQ